nr:hypothetical protein [Enterovibrio nigricans]
MNIQNQRARDAIFAKLKSAPRQKETKPLPEWQAWHSENLNERTNRFVEKISASHAEIQYTREKTLDDDLSHCINHEGFKRILLGKNNPLTSRLKEGCLQSHIAVYDQAIETFKTSLFNEVDAGITLLMRE